MLPVSFAAAVRLARDTGIVIAVEEVPAGDADLAADPVVVVPAERADLLEGAGAAENRAAPALMDEVFRRFPEGAGGGALLDRSDPDPM